MKLSIPKKLKKSIRKSKINNSMIINSMPFAIVRQHIIDTQQCVQVKKDEVISVVGKSINYRPLGIKAKKLKKYKEEEKCDLYKDYIPQFNAVKSLVYSKDTDMTLDKLNYKKLDLKIKKLEEERNCEMELLELNLYSSFVDGFYILKAHMNKG
jgi:hypothetical protein